MVACSQPNSSSSTGDPETGSLAKGADLAEAHQQAPTTVAGLGHALIKHGFGETMVALPAERVVVLQANDEDYLIALRDYARRNPAPASIRRGAGHADRIRGIYEPATPYQAYRVL